MLFKRDELERIASGEITLAFRRWRRPTVRAGGQLTTAAGVLAIESVEPIALAAIDDADARRAGYRSRADAITALRKRADGRAYRIEFSLSGPDPRVALRERADIDDAELAELRERLARLDRRSPSGPWTGLVLDLVDARPETLAAELADELGWERDRFKRAVRRLKALGLTESLPVGYRLSPRGRALREHL